MIISRLRSICEDAANGPKSGTVHATDLTAHDPTINRADAVSFGNAHRDKTVANPCDGHRDRFRLSGEPLVENAATIIGL